MAPSRASALMQQPCMRHARHCLQRRSFLTTARRLNAREESNLPRVANASFWSSLIPRPLRRKANNSAPSAPHDPAAAAERRAGVTFFLLGILIGSNAIQILTLRREHLNFTRETDAKLGLLREVIQKVRDGEPVDVRRALGTGDPKQEEEWEKALKEVEETDMLWEGRRKRDAARAAKAEKANLKEAPSAEPVVAGEPEKTDMTKTARPKFLM